MIKNDTEEIMTLQKRASAMRRSAEQYANFNLSTFGLFEEDFRLGSPYFNMRKGTKKIWRLRKPIKGGKWTEPLKHVWGKE